MPISETKLSELKVKSMEEANRTMEEIIDSYHNPHTSLSGESLIIWNELEEWGWLEDYPIDKPENLIIYRRMIAMTRFRHLRWEAEHPNSEKRKLSKWEKVMGRANR